MRTIPGTSGSSSTARWAAGGRWAGCSNACSDRRGTGRRWAARSRRARHGSAAPAQRERRERRDRQRGGRARGGHASRSAARLTYPEWNVHRNRYRPDWCTVIECDPPVGDGAPMAMPDGSDPAAAAGPARDGSGALPASTPGRRHRHRRRRRGPGRGAGRLFAQRGALRREPAAAAGSLGPDPARRVGLGRRTGTDGTTRARAPAAGRRRAHDRAPRSRRPCRAARVQLPGSGLGAGHAHQGIRRGVWTAGSVNAWAASSPAPTPGWAPPSGTVRRIVEEQGGTSRRLLVVISDGFAYDHGYEGRYGEADARRALAETRRRGVGCLCLSIGAGVEAAALRRVFGTAAHASVPSVGQLPPIIGPLFRSAMRSAEAQRRVYQRTERTRERLEIERRAS